MDTFAILGGRDKTGKRKSILKFDPGSKEWKTVDKKVMNAARSHHAVVRVPKSAIGA